MDALPQVGQKYQHKKWGEVEVEGVAKRGRGYSVSYRETADWDNKSPRTNPWHDERIKDFQKATK